MKCSNCSESISKPLIGKENKTLDESSLKKNIYKIKINKNNKIISKKIFKKFSIQDGAPDGKTLDKNKNLWVAHFHGACISVFNQKQN